MKTQTKAFLANWPSCECCSFMIVWTILSTGGISSSSRWTPTVCISCKTLEEAIFPEVLEEFQVTKMNWFTWDKWSNCTPYRWDSPLHQMLLHGEQREEQSQDVIEGHVPAAEQAHMGAIQGSAERSSRQSHRGQGFQMANGTICTYTQNKLGLIAYYDKQWVLLDGIHTEPIEYHLLEEEYCGWNGKQLFTHKPPFRAVLHIIHNWLVGLHKGRQDIIDFQRPDGFSGPQLSAFQLTWLIQLMDIYIVVIFFRQGATRESQALQ